MLLHLIENNVCKQYELHESVNHRMYLPWGSQYIKPNGTIEKRAIKNITDCNISTYHLLTRMSMYVILIDNTLLCMHVRSLTHPAYTPYNYRHSALLMMMWWSQPVWARGSEHECVHMYVNGSCHIFYLWLCF